MILTNKQRITFFCLLVFCGISFSCHADSTPELTFSIEEVLKLAQTKYLKACEALDIEKGFPRNAHPDGSWRQVSADDWTSGFFPGTLWYIYEGTNDWRVKDRAIQWTEALEPVQYMHYHHDIGFMMYCSYGNGLRLINKPEYKEILLQSARTLTSRYNPKTGTIRSWDWAGEPEKHPVIIDNMMNLELLIWAGNNADNAVFKNVAESHADTTLKHHFRPDGSSYHLVVYDGFKGGVREKRTVQGYAKESSWARGQAWGMYGYTYMYAHFGKQEYLRMAEKTTQNFIKRLPSDQVPFWDFDAPEIPNEPRDAVSGALGACAMLSLYELTEKEEYYHSAIHILNELSSDQYLNRDPDFGGLIEHSTGAKPANSEVDVHLNYADYYYLEALLQLKRLTAQRKANTLNQQTDDFQGIWYGIGKTADEHKFKYSGGMGTYPVKHRPMAIYHQEANKTFFTYGASTTTGHTDLHHAVAYFDHQTKKLSKPTIILNKATGDAHDNPVIAIDQQGYVYVFSTSHGNDRPSYIHKSKKPFSIEEFEQVQATKSWNKRARPFDNFSYAQVWNKQDSGFVMFSTKYSFPALRTIGYQSTTNGQDFDAFKTIAAFGEGHYQITGNFDNVLMSAFNFHPVQSPMGSGINHRTNLYFVQTKDEGKTWQNVQGETLDLPLVVKDNPALILDLEQVGQCVFLKDIGVDQEGQPIILFLTSKGGYPGPQNGPFEWHTANYNQGKWHIAKAFESDHNYDMGSLYVDQDKWQIIAPTAAAEEPYAVGGIIEQWESKNQGKSWKKIKVLTAKDGKNHSYVRRPVHYHPDFKAFWFDGWGRKPSSSQLYYANEKGEVFESISINK
ncbi:BNR-4 repeat-containing protein [Persicobacter diffluens]|uniref:Glucuronyl hydrolase n=1 Tax=Persicobacter diffluens TaxID=981 RepID=A0AAN4W280_9BACT|nr:hypothetical protein PEDI_49760 [Persicobacter diffluens]